MQIDRCVPFARANLERNMAIMLAAGQNSSYNTSTQRPASVGSNGAVDNNAWYRQIAAGWARRMIDGDSPGAWAEYTEGEVRFALQQLNLRPGQRVLDLGCGWGRHSLCLASYGLRVTAMDLSHDLLALARYNAERRGLNINWVEADIVHAPLRGHFDAVAQFCDNFLTWFDAPQRTLDALWNVASLLKPGGRLLFGANDWLPELPARHQDYDEWPGGAAIYRHRFDAGRRLAQSQTVIFGPGHERTEYHRLRWWPAQGEMEMLFAQAGLRLIAHFNDFQDARYRPTAPGLVYLLERDA